MAVAFWATASHPFNKVRLCPLLDNQRDVPAILPGRCRIMEEETNSCMISHSCITTSIPCFTVAERWATFVYQVGPLGGARGWHHDWGAKPSAHARPFSYTPASSRHTPLRLMVAPTSKARSLLDMNCPVASWAGHRRPSGVRAVSGTAASRLRRCANQDRTTPPGTLYERSGLWVRTK